jgi:NAD(P)-dependent dehydrogenase (short-subunit alcohol dehydrogenase family)
MPGAFEGRVIVITGAGRGVGREHARFLASQGAAVVINDLGTGGDGIGADSSPAKELADEIRAAGGQALANDSDVADPDGAQRLIDEAVDAYGTVHGLINNAGILRDRTVITMEDGDWDTSVRVNLTGAFLPTRAAARHWRGLAKAGEPVDASVVFTSSESGVFANAGQANYASAKAGVAALSEVCHKELRRYGVRSNTILPRARTRLTEDIVGAPKEGRFDRWDPANLAPFVAYLLGEACEISGQTFLVGGGKIQRVAPWSLDPSWLLERDERWTLDDIAEAVAAAGLPTNAGRDTGGIR